MNNRKIIKGYKTLISSRFNVDTSEDKFKDGIIYTLYSDEFNSLKVGFAENDKVLEKNLSNTNLEDSFAYSTQFENVKIQGADFTNVFLPKDIIRKFCEIATGTNPITNRETRETLECDYI